MIYIVYKTKENFRKFKLKEFECWISFYDHLKTTSRSFSLSLSKDEDFLDSEEEYRQICLDYLDSYNLVSHVKIESDSELDKILKHGNSLLRDFVFKEIVCRKMELERC